MLNVCETFNMPQTSIYKGFEACYVNRLIDFVKNLSTSAVGWCCGYRIYYMKQIFDCPFLNTMSVQKWTLCFMLLLIIRQL